MSILADYERFRFLWGAVDWESGTGSPYSTAQTGTTLGTSAAPGAGVGVRRCVLHFDRTTWHTGSDDAEMHFDFLNITGGDPDDTWTSGDYTTLEGHLDTWWGSVKPLVYSGVKLSAYDWYRYGPGVGSPNPAERVTSRSVAGTAGAPALPPQVACSITLRTGVRRSWGRTYLPGLASGVMDTPGTLASANVDTIAAATAALYSSANADDFPMVVVSKHLSAVLSVEAVEVDNDLDVIRRRRWKTATYKNVINS